MVVTVVVFEMASNEELSYLSDRSKYRIGIYPNRSRAHINRWAQINAEVQHFKPV